MTEGRFVDDHGNPLSVPHNVVLGEGTWVNAPHAFTRYRSERPFGLRVGHDSGLYYGTMFDLGPDGQVEIGDYVTAVGLVVCSNSTVEIGSYTFISYNVVMADSFDVVPGRGSVPRRGHDGSGIVLGETCWLGVRVILLAGARLGEGAVVGAGAVVDFEVPPYAVVAGNPARVVGRAPPRPSSLEARA